MEFQRAICILGMHRSGTSVVARAFNLLGAYLGEEKEMLPPVPDNQQGVWERKDIVDFHDRVLAYFSSTWHTFPSLPDCWEKSEEIKPFRKELHTLIKHKFMNYPLWVWKDPRTSVLLPLWKEVLRELGVKLLCVYVVRNPLDVARSLAKRESFPWDKSLGLWFSYNVTALRACLEAPCFFYLL